MFVKVCVLCLWTRAIHPLHGIQAQLKKSQQMIYKPPLRRCPKANGNWICRNAETRHYFSVLMKCCAPLLFSILMNIKFCQLSLFRCTLDSNQICKTDPESAFGKGKA